MTAQLLAGPPASGPASFPTTVQGYTRTELDVQYSPSSCVPSLQAYLDEYARLSAATRNAYKVRTGLRYGPRPEETLDFFPAAMPCAPVQVFVHGGNWQALTKDESAFAAPPFLAAGAAFVALNYGLAPDYPLDDIVAMVRRAVRWLHAHAGELGFDPRRIHLSGSSAGAHLVAMALVEDGPYAGAGASTGPGVNGRRFGGRHLGGHYLSGLHPHEPGVGALVAGATLLSGIYDLEPVRHSYVNDALGLDADAARRNSPVRLPMATQGRRPLVIARGGNETAEYLRQHAEMVGAASTRGPVVAIVSERRDHFDLPYELGNPATALGAAVFSQMGLGHMDLQATAVAE